MDKAAKLKHSKPFKDSFWSEFEEVDNLVSKMLEEIQSELQLQRFNKTKYKSNNGYLSQPEEINKWNSK